jgi:hypothetical protein
MPGADDKERVIMPATHLYRIRLSLARTKDHPEGSDRDGYEFTAPLDADGRISLEGFKRHKQLCFVHRIRDGAIEERGLLVHRPGGKSGIWAFDYESSSGVDDEAGYRFADHRFQPGEYVSIRDDEGILKTYRVQSVTAS